MAAKTCNFTELRAVTISPSKNWDQLQRVKSKAAVRSLTRAEHSPYSLGPNPARPRESHGPTRTHNAPAEVTVLRI